MRNQMGKLALLLMFTCASVLTAARGQEERKKPESYSGVAMATGGSLGGRSTWFDFKINEYTTDEEVENFVTLLREKGQHALLNALGKEDKGQLSVVGRVGNPIGIARKRQQGTKTIITIVTAREMPFIELYRNNRSVDYPFGILQVTLNEKGEGMGQIMIAAKLKFDKKKGHYEIESYGNQYIKAANVRPWK